LFLCLKHEMALFHTVTVDYFLGHVFTVCNRSLDVTIITVIMFHNHSSNTLLYLLGSTRLVASIQGFSVIVLWIIWQTVPAFHNTIVTRSFQNLFHSSTVTRCLTSLSVTVSTAAHATVLPEGGWSCVVPRDVPLCPGVPLSSSP
jgi:hypothetical protein